MPAWVAPAVIAGVQLASQAASALSGAAAARAAGRESARLRLIQGAEEIRRTEMAQDRAYGMGVATGYASGTMMKETGSQQIYLREFREEQARQLAYQRKALWQEVQTLKKGGQVTASQITAQGAQAGLQTAASTAQWYLSR